MPAENIGSFKELLSELRGHVEALPDRYPYADAKTAILGKIDNIAALGQNSTQLTQRLLQNTTALFFSGLHAISTSKEKNFVALTHTLSSIQQTASILHAALPKDLNSLSLEAPISAAFSPQVQRLSKELTPEQCLCLLMLATGRSFFSPEQEQKYLHNNSNRLAQTAHHVHKYLPFLEIGSIDWLYVTTFIAECTHMLTGGVWVLIAQEMLYNVINTKERTEQNAMLLTLTSIIMTILAICGLYRTLARANNEKAILLVGICIFNAYLPIVPLIQNNSDILAIGLIAITSGIVFTLALVAGLMFGNNVYEKAAQKQLFENLGREYQISTRDLPESQKTRVPFHYGKAFGSHDIAGIIAANPSSFTLLLDLHEAMLGCVPSANNTATITEISVSDNPVPGAGQNVPAVETPTQSATPLPPRVGRCVIL